jgi:hypothetical protein
MHDHAHRTQPVRVPTAVSPSLLRLSGAQRLVVAGVLAALLWSAVVWAVA